MYLGYNAGSTGVYTMTGGTLETNGLAVGSGGTGQFKQSGGTVTLPNLNVNANSEYQLSGAGQLNVQGISVGNSAGGIGTFTQSGGTVNTSGLQVGTNGTGVYTLSGGSLTVPVTSVGPYAGVKGTMNQTGGTHTFTTNLYVGNDADAPGTSVYTLGAGTLTSPTAAIWVKPSGRIVQTGGTLKVAFGDTNLDGVVDFNDLVRVAQHYNVTDGYRLWSEGDVNYDGNVDFNDLVKIAQHYNGAMPAQGVDFGASFGSDMAAAFASVPEPATGLMVAGGMLGMLGRRKSRRVRPSASR
jgi:hypothetical protein